MKHQHSARIGRLCFYDYDQAQAYIIRHNNEQKAVLHLVDNSGNTVALYAPDLRVHVCPGHPPFNIEEEFELATH